MPKDQVENRCVFTETLYERANAFRAISVSPAPSENKWHLASGLQKAIRRGHADLAQSYAVGLLEHHPGYVFRRLSVVALEDVGPGDWLACALTLEAFTSSRLRRKIGELPVLLSLVTALASAPKSRALADQANIAAGSTTSAEERAALVDELPSLVQSIARKATALEGLALGLPAVWRATQEQQSVVEHSPDGYGDELIAGYRAATFDKHTHEGLRAIATLAGRFTARQIALVLFYIEGCHVDRQLAWPGHQTLTAQSHELDYLTKYGFESREHVRECQEFVHERRAALNLMRRKSVGS